jgi:hypothetical protein
MNPARQVSPDARRSDARRARSSPSAGLPADEPAAAERIAELDARIARLEGGAGYRERGRQLLRQVLPAEASRHFRNAGREELLGIRSIVDFWIRRIDDAESRAAAGDTAPERIDIE